MNTPEKEESSNVAQTLESALKLIQDGTFDATDAVVIFVKKVPHLGLLVNVMTTIQIPHDTLAVIDIGRAALSQQLRHPLLHKPFSHRLN